MDKISYEDKMRIQTFREIGFGHRTNFPKEDWKLSSVKSNLLIISH